MSDKPNVVLVHGGFVDGSGWQGVYGLLTADGYRVSVVQNPTLSLAGDAAATRMILDRQDERRLFGAQVTGEGCVAWPTRRCRGAWTRLAPRSASRPGATSPADTWSQRRT